MRPLVVRVGSSGRTTCHSMLHTWGATAVMVVDGTLRTMGARGQHVWGRRRLAAMAIAQVGRGSAVRGLAPRTQVSPIGVHSNHVGGLRGAGRTVGLIRGAHRGGASVNVGRGSRMSSGRGGSH